MSVLASTWVLALAGLQLLARAAEATGEVYPYRSEDWLRYLLPALWTGSQPLVLLAGPSTARENLLESEFEAAFAGYRIFQGGISDATLTDVMASLAYVERVYGREALPEIMVLGLSPRFLAERPVKRPFPMALDRYSPRYRLPDGPRIGFELERKPPLSGLAAQARFLTQKQGRRYRAALAWLVSEGISHEASQQLWESRAVRTLLQSGLGRLLLPQRLRELGIHQYAMEQTSARKYVGGWRLKPTGMLQFMNNPDSHWSYLRTWDPASDSVEVAARAQRLIAYLDEHRIDTYVVNLPMRSIGRAHQAPDFDSRFRNFVAATFAPLPVLDLREFLNDAELRDLEHAFPAGARRVSHEVIAFVAAVMDARAAKLAAPPARSADRRVSWPQLAARGGTDR